MLAALEAGALHADHLWPLLDLVTPIRDDGTRAEVEAALLGWVADRAARGEISQNGGGVVTAVSPVGVVTG